ncbi:hypothetical protein FHU10_0558 [Serratia fonticola]|uniref:Uncharacterized protein n=1 Tax=Serratia fonticola TaxID=47917 RepID=A0A542BL93_SERFO|nr:hypothetical protein [Serratia fonticola]TQI79364.1 hypothetical protein FHU09_1892 [Serratia fonticola]TQI98611.1 hypothetical protein FHU11_4156 [Serratia fonticola]TVZ68139.1 hypothetical protein FHU10_0558 [Serratia fonticola]
MGKTDDDHTPAHLNAKERRSDTAWQKQYPTLMRLSLRPEPPNRRIPQLMHNVCLIVEFYS